MRRQAPHLLVVSSKFREREWATLRRPARYTLCILRYFSAVSDENYGRYDRARHRCGCPHSFGITLLLRFNLEESPTRDVIGKRIGRYPVNLCLSVPTAS